MAIITRFAPAPSGSLHLGNARTALFNWLYARANNGLFLLRIEDTDNATAKAAAIDAIVRDLSWLNITADAPVVIQSCNRLRHQEVAQQLLNRNKAYYCNCPKELIAAQKLANPY